MRMIVPEPATELNSPIRTVLWQRIDSPGSEWCAVEREPDGWRLHGIVLTEVATAPVLVHYAVALATDWSTRVVEIAMRSGAESEPRKLKLTVAPDQRWQIEREPVSGPGHAQWTIWRRCTASSTSISGSLPSPIPCRSAASTPQLARRLR